MNIIEICKLPQDKLKERLEDKFFLLDVQVIYGGQPVYYYIISVE